MASSSSSSSLPLPSTDDHQHQYAYEVFLSFRGEDTRYAFTDHLHRALIGRGIRTFRDNEELNRGEDISQELLKAIEESRVSIIVFSEKYASSRWCLDELVHILECRRSKGQEVRPVFYRVDPSDVRNQRGAFGDGFAELDQSKYEDEIRKWRTALKEAADLSGWPYKDGEYEAKFIDVIVDELSAKLVIPLPVADHPVGLESCREAVEELLDLEENVVRMVGIWGAGGIGKTTIAKDVFNSIRHEFEGSCFLADVRSNSKISNGLAQLQEQLLSDVLGDSKLKVRHVGEGVGLIKARMKNKKVLIILDDVSDYSSQLKKLVPSQDCFGPRSRILITTRDKGCLGEVDVYEVEILKDCQAMKLFCMTAFGENIPKPPSEYQELAEHAIHYAQGLPLALIVLGSHLFLQSIKEWEDTLSSCRGDPIQSVLRISYDALEANLKEIFLDIACFFKGKCVDDVKPILQSCYGLNLAIEQLQKKALLRIERYVWKKDMIWMHDLIEEMGIQIANPKPDESTRLWEFDDVERALSDDNTETEKIKGIQIDRRVEGARNEICLNAKSFSKMKNLRYFSIKYYIKWSGNINHLPNELKYFYWYHYPSRSVLVNYRLRKLVRLQISHATQITRFWEGLKNLPNLKCMDISDCESLRELPDLSGIPNLVELRLRRCERLVEIPHSIGSLEKIEILDLEDCRWPPEFPKFIGKLDSLRELNLTWNGGIWGKEKLIKQVWVECCQNLTNLEILNLWGCPGHVRFLREALISPDDDSGSLVRFPKLRQLRISMCDLSTADFIGDLHCWETLKNLHLSCNDFVTLPALGKFVNLEYLSLENCTSLREIPELPPNKLRVGAMGCRSLEGFSKLPKYSSNTIQMNLRYCYRFSECLGDDMKMMENILLNNQDSRFSLLFPGSEVPKWFQYCSKEVIYGDDDSEDDSDDDSEDPWYTTGTCAVSFESHSKLELDNIAGVAICFVGYIRYCAAYLSINGVHIHLYILDIKFNSSHTWVGYTPLSSEIKGKLLGQGPYQCRVQFLGLLKIKSCGVHLVCQLPYENSNKMVMADEPAGESGMHAE